MNIEDILMLKKNIYRIQNFKILKLRLSVHLNSQSESTQAFHTYRINLSPFTKDFRVWGAIIENSPISLRLSSIAT